MADNHMQALFTIYNFHFPLTVAFLQMTVIAPVCYFVAKPKLDWSLARAFVPLSIVNVLNVISGLMGIFLLKLLDWLLLTSHSSKVIHIVSLHPFRASCHSERAA